MAGFNRIILVGNLTRDPEYKTLTSGQGVCRLGLATNRQFKNRQTGAMVQEVCFVDVDVWGAQAESCRQYLQKGRSVLIEGRLKLDSWEDQTGQTRSKHSIVADRVVFLSSSAGAGAELTDPEMPDESLTITKASKDKELADQINDLKAKISATSSGAIKVRKKTTSGEETAVFQDTVQHVASQAPTTGELMFPDEPPFKEELPF